MVTERGLGFMIKNFDAVSNNPNWCVHAIDLKGYGLSSRPNFDKKVSINEFFIDSIEEWRIKRGLTNNRNLVCSHSLGSYISLLYNFKYPDTIKKLLLVSPAGIYSPPNLQLNIPKWFCYLWENLNISPFIPIRLSGPFGSLIASGWTFRRFAKLSKLEQSLLHDYAYKIFNKRGSGEYYMYEILSPGAIAKKPLLNEIHKVNCDTHWSFGDEDWMPKESGLKSCEIIKEKTNFNSEFKIFKNAGHHIYLDNITDFNNFLISEMKNFEKKY